MKLTPKGLICYWFGLVVETALGQIHSSDIQQGFWLTHWQLFGIWETYTNIAHVAVWSHKGGSGTTGTARVWVDCLKFSGGCSNCNVCWTQQGGVTPSDDQLCGVASCCGCIGVGDADIMWVNPGLVACRQEVARPLCTSGIWRLLGPVECRG